MLKVFFFIDFPVLTLSMLNLWKLINLTYEKERRDELNIKKIKKRLKVKEKKKGNMKKSNKERKNNNNNKSHYMSSYIHVITYFSLIYSYFYTPAFLVRIISCLLKSMEFTACLSH